MVTAVQRHVWDSGIDSMDTALGNGRFFDTSI